MRNHATDPAQQLIDFYDLKPHIEGGYFKAMYVSPFVLERTHSAYANRLLCSHIYFLLVGGAKSKIHMLDADEIFHHYSGGVMELIELCDSKPPTRVRLGKDFTHGEKACHIIRAGTWFGATVGESDRFSFVGCTVSPSFDWDHFKVGSKDLICELFPESWPMIETFFD